MTRDSGEIVNPTRARPTIDAVSDTNRKELTVKANKNPVVSFLKRYEPTDERARRLLVQFGVHQGMAAYNNVLRARIRKGMTNDERIELERQAQGAALRAFRRYATKHEKRHRESPCKPPGSVVSRRKKQVRVRQRD